MDTQTADSSSPTMHISVRPSAVPPYSSGAAMPSSPSSAPRFQLSVGKRSSRSISLASGATSSRANARTMSRSILCSSVKSYSTATAYLTNRPDGQSCCAGRRAAPMPVIHLIRHSQASFGSDSYDVLSELGHRQSALLDAALASPRRAGRRVVTGSLQRQIDTAGACRLSGPVKPEIDPRWNEYDTAGVLTGHGDLPRGADAPIGAPSGIASPEFQALLDGAFSRGSRQAMPRRSRSAGRRSRPGPWER